VTSEQDKFPNIEIVNASLRLLFGSLGRDRVLSFRTEYVPTWKDTGYKEDPILYVQRISKEFRRFRQ
jgi:hypothetical protein